VPARDRLLPSIIDRLTDDDPAVQRPDGDRFSFDLQQYRDAVFRDLDALLNTISPLSQDDLLGLDAVRDSVLNYGMPALSGGAAMSIEPRALERRLREVIQRYEPRIVAETVKINVEIAPGAMNHRALTFRLDGLLWAQPMPEQIYVKTQLDLETGHVTLSEVATKERG
jgi:type VI secretion system protein ImpF